MTTLQRWCDAVMKQCLAVILFLLLQTQGLYAQSNAADDFGWELSADKKEVYITSYSGGSSAVIIPKTIEKLPVTKVSGFANNAVIISVVIPDSVTELRRQSDSFYLGAFTNCTALQSVSLPASLKKIDAWTFSGCVSLEKIRLGENIASIGSHAFADCTALTTVNLPKGITKIAWGTFCRCASLKEIVIPETVTEISYMAFADCTALQKIILPKSVLHIGPQAFQNCSALTDVSIAAETVNFHDYGGGIFSGCAGLKNETRQEIAEMGYTGSFD